jgi:hypothetical protein
MGAIVKDEIAAAVILLVQLTKQFSLSTFLHKVKGKPMSQ